MLLSARAIADAQSINGFRYATEVTLNRGDAGTFSFQLVDLDQMLPQHGYNPPGLRYIPADGATVTVQFQNLDAAKQFSRVATNPFPGDKSIFRVAILGSDPLDGTQSLKITLIEGAVVRSFLLRGILRVGSTELCGC